MSEDGSVVAHVASTSATPRSARHKKKSPLAKLASHKVTPRQSAEKDLVLGAELQDSHSREDLAEALNRQRLSSESKPAYPIEAEVHLAQNAATQQEDSDEGIELGGMQDRSDPFRNTLSKQRGIEVLQNLKPQTITLGGEKDRKKIFRVGGNDSEEEEASPMSEGEHGSGGFEIVGKQLVTKGEKRYREQNSDGDELVRDTGAIRSTKRSSVEKRQIPNTSQLQRETCQANVRHENTSHRTERRSVGTSSKNGAVPNGDRTFGAKFEIHDDDDILQTYQQQLLRTDTDDEIGDQLGDMHRPPRSFSPQSRPATSGSLMSQASVISSSMFKDGPVADALQNDTLTQGSSQSSVMPMVSTAEARNR